MIWDSLNRYRFTIQVYSENIMEYTKSNVKNFNHINKRYAPSPTSNEVM